VKRFFNVFNCLIIAFIFPTITHAHSIDERYDLPIPLSFFIVGSGLIVFLSFLLMMISFPKWHGGKASVILENPSKNKPLQLSLFLFKAISLVLFFSVLGACFYGNSDPLVNLAPNFIWITWWLGLTLWISIFGNCWPILNPWLILFDLFKLLCKRWMPNSNFRFPLTWPKHLHVYLASFFLLVWSWLELIYPVAFMPHKIGTLILIWTCINFIMMFLFGPEQWQTKGDVFSVYFRWLGRFGIFFHDQSSNSLCCRFPSSGLINDSNSSYNPKGISTFIVAMLSTVLFDGLHSNRIWLVFERKLQESFPYLMDVNSYFSGTFGLILTWLVFWSLYLLCCFMAKIMGENTKGFSLSDYLAPSLIPIAIGYLIAHNFSSFIVQAPNIIYLLADPFHLGWNLFGARSFRPDIGTIDAGFIWYLAVSAIILGHLVSIWVNHQLLLKLTCQRRAVLLMSGFLMVMMVLLTMTSMTIIAEPMTIS
jgi:hypothetical protein